MDLTIAYMPDATIHGYELLVMELANNGFEVEVLVLGPLQGGLVSNRSASPDRPSATPGDVETENVVDLDVRVLNWDEGNGSRYLAHYYAAVYSRADLVLIVGPGAQPDSGTVAAMVDSVQKGYDVVIGSRHHKLSRLNYPFTRWLISKTYNWVASLVLRTNTTDATSGLKLFTKVTLIESLRDSATKEITFHLELLIRARRRGARIAEVPVVIDYQHSPYVLRASDVATTIVDTFKLWWR